MIGFIRASSRFLRDRRILLGSFLAVILSLVSIVWLNALRSSYTRVDLNSGIVLVLMGFLWPSLWGMIVASILPKDEYRQGTLELLLAIPITPRRLVLAMSITPILITSLLFIAVSPGLFIVLSLKGNVIVLTRACWVALLCQPLVWFLLFSSVWFSASARCSITRRNLTPLEIIMVVCYMIFIIAIASTRLRNSLAFPLLMASPLFINVLIPLIDSMWRSVPFSLEDMESRTDSVTKKIGGLLAFLRSHQGTIFEREEGISKYETLEQIRQQTLGGPFLQEQMVRDITFTGLFLFSPLALIIFIFPQYSMLPFLRISFGVLLLLSMISAAVTALREILEERSTLRLDSIRTSLLSLREVTRVKEWVARILPQTVLKWYLIFGLVEAFLSGFSFFTFVVVGFLGVQGWLALSLAARLGLRLGLSARDNFEGILWIALIFFFWLIAPFLLAAVLPLYANLPPAVTFLLPVVVISPLYTLFSASSQIIQWQTALILLAGLGLQGLLWYGCDWYNQRIIRSAWR